MEEALTNVENFVEDEYAKVVRPETVKLDVAVTGPPKNPVPEKYPLPFTSIALFGVVVPIPTFPPAVARYVEPVVVNCVVDAPPLNCWSCENEFAVVVPNASETVFAVLTNG